MFRRKRKASDFSSEMEAHIQLETDRLREQGVSEREARAWGGAQRVAFAGVMSGVQRHKGSAIGTEGCLAFDGKNARERVAARPFPATALC